MANWFVAFPVEPGEWYHELVQKIPTGIRVFKPEDLHMTVFFMGNLPGEKLEKESGIIRKVLQDTRIKPFAVSAERFLLLPRENRFSALSLEMSPLATESLTGIRQLQESISTATGIPAGKRSYLPHITIGRPVRGISERDLRKTKDFVIHPLDIPINFLITRIALYTWSEDRLKTLFKIFIDVKLN